MNYFVSNIIMNKKNWKNDYQGQNSKDTIIIYD